MENLYFPIFLVILAAVVIGVFKRAGSDRRGRGSRQASGSTVRRHGEHGLGRNTGSKASFGGHTVSHSKHLDIWQTRRERAAKASFGQKASPQESFHAGYLHPDRHHADRETGAYGVQDQNISKAEHLGIDEYLSKQERTHAEEQAAEAGGLSMTALKYEPADATDSKNKSKKQAGSKP